MKNITTVLTQTRTGKRLTPAQRKEFTERFTYEVECPVQYVLEDLRSFASEYSFKSLRISSQIDATMFDEYCY